MARIPWPSTAVNVSILCKRPGGGGGGVGEGLYFWTTRGSLRQGRVRAHLSRGQGPPYPPPPFSLLSVNTAERHRAPSCTLCSWFERGGKWPDHVFYPPDCSDWARVFVFERVFQSESSQAVDKIPGRAGSATQTNEHTRICLTVRTRLFPFISPTLRAKRRPGRAPRAPSHTSSFENECHLVIETAH